MKQLYLAPTSSTKRNLITGHLPAAAGARPDALKNDDGNRPARSAFGLLLGGKNVGHDVPQPRPFLPDRGMCRGGESVRLDLHLDLRVGHEVVVPAGVPL